MQQRLSAAERVARARAAHGDWDGPESRSDEMPMAPQRVIRLLEEHTPADTVVTCDAGENRLFMMHWFRNRMATSAISVSSASRTAW